MGLLDDITADPNPVEVTLSFNDYVDGEKLSTLARNYFATKAADVGATTIEEYFAELLLIKLKETLVEEAQEAKRLANETAQAEVEAKQAELAAVIEATLAEADAKIEAAAGIELVKK